MTNHQASAVPGKISEEAVPVNRYASAPAWRAVDNYFTAALSLIHISEPTRPY